MHLVCDSDETDHETVTALARVLRSVANKGSALPPWSAVHATATVNARPAAIGA
jgi:hypothetical protein